jgi:hypothetical protein
MAAVVQFGSSYRFPDVEAHLSLFNITIINKGDLLKLHGSLLNMLVNFLNITKKGSHITQ